MPRSLVRGLLPLLALGLCASIRSAQRHEPDWLRAEGSFPAEVRLEADGRRLVLANGLIRRVFKLEPGFGCIALDDLRADRPLLRATRPEARLTVNGEVLLVGGLGGQPDQAYSTPGWIDALRPWPGALSFTSWRSGPVRERLTWKRVRHHAPDAVWPPRGVHLELEFEGQVGGQRLEVTVHYELYDDLPVTSKWLQVRNPGPGALELDRVATELLAVIEHDNPVETRPGVPLEPPRTLHVETDFAFGGFTHRNALAHVVHWRPDPAYATQVNYLRQSPCLLEVEPTHGPDVLLAPGEQFTSWRTYELIHDSSDRERRGLALRRMYRVIAPWVTENPLILHVQSIEPEVVRRAIDQAAECGFEMVSLSFGSGLDMEDDSPENHAALAQLTRHATQRGVQLGGYSLLSSRRIQPDGDNCLHPDTGLPGGGTHGFCPALASDWGQEYFRKLRAFFEATGFLQFTHDGSYPGDLDAATRPPLQRGLEDSQWVQWNVIADFYRWLRARGAYLRVPDYYFLVGGNECGMGYREVNWSLPRAQQVVHTRQNIYDGTWEKTPSMGWMFVPLTEYHGGGEVATVEPLDSHLEHYVSMLRSNLGMGVQAVYRGTRLYDTERVRDAVQGEVRWFKEHRDLLESDLVHGRRADGQDLDWMLHVNPRLETRGLLVVYNPLDVSRERELRVDTYYTGATDEVTVTDAAGVETTRALDRDFGLTLRVEVPPGGFTWFTLR